MPRSRVPGPLSVNEPSEADNLVGSPYGSFGMPGVSGQADSLALVLKGQRTAARVHGNAAVAGAAVPDTADLFEPEAPTARETFKEVYRALAASDNPAWQPTGKHEAIWPDRMLYQTVEIRPNGDVLGTYKDVRTYVRACQLTGRRRVDRGGGKEIANQTIEVHHLMEDHFMKQFGVTRDEGRCVSLEWNEHAYFSKELPFHLPRDIFFDIDVIYDAHADMYTQAGHPEWVEELRYFLILMRGKLLRAYMGSTLPGATSPEFNAVRARVTAFLSHLG